MGAKKEGMCSRLLVRSHFKTDFEPRLSEKLVGKTGGETRGWLTPKRELPQASSFRFCLGGFPLDHIDHVLGGVGLFGIHGHGKLLGLDGPRFLFVDLCLLGLLSSTGHASQARGKAAGERPLGPVLDIVLKADQGQEVGAFSWFGSFHQWI